MCGGASPTKNTTRYVLGSWLHEIRLIASSSAWFTDSGESPPPSARNCISFAYIESRSLFRSTTCVTYASPRSRYATSPIEISGACFACASVLAIDQIFSFAASIRPPMLPVVSSTNTTSTRFVAVGGAMCDAACVTGVAWPRSVGYTSTAPTVVNTRPASKMFVFMWISVVSRWIGIDALNARSRGGGSPPRPCGARD